MAFCHFLAPAARTSTCDPLLRKQMLYPLSYAGVPLLERPQFYHFPPNPQANQPVPLENRGFAALQKPPLSDWRRRVMRPDESMACSSSRATW